MPREERTFWVWNGWDTKGPREEVGVATGEPGQWWFPNLGQPGWGQSLQVGHGAFETVEACVRYHLDDARRSLKHAQGRVERIEEFALKLGVRVGVAT